MSVLTFDTAVYVGDIHGTRLVHLQQALRVLELDPSALLCTMDLDQILSMQELVELQKKYQAPGRLAALTPGNHEAAVIHHIGIDSSTYRAQQQNTNIHALIEAFNLPHFKGVREFVEAKLEVEGGMDPNLWTGDRR